MAMSDLVMKAVLGTKPKPFHLPIIDNPSHLWPIRWLQRTAL